MERQFPAMTLANKHPEGNAHLRDATIDATRGLPASMLVYGSQYPEQSHCSGLYNHKPTRCHRSPARESINLLSSRLYGRLRSFTGSCALPWGIALVGCTTDRELPGSPAGLTLPRRFLYSVVMTWLSLDAARTAPITGRRAAPLI